MDELAFIETFLRENAAYVRERHAARNQVTMTVKSNASDLLTEADLTVQQRAVEALAKAFPGDRLVAEEGDCAAYPENRNARCWVLDPIDGTNNFVRGLFPCFGISLAFAEEGVPRAGGVMLPVSGHLFLAERGGGATLNGEAIHVSDVQDIGAAKVELDFGWVEERDLMLNRAAKLIKSVGQVRCTGSAVVALCQIACGETDGFAHMTLQPWDYAASQVIVEEAGGMATRLDGKALHLFDGRKGVLMSNGAIHGTMRGLIRERRVARDQRR